jgi:hypothetical protein
MADDEPIDRAQAQLSTSLADDVGRDLATLAEVPETSFVQFCDLLAWQILEARLGTPPVSPAPALSETDGVSPGGETTPFAGHVIRGSDVSHSLDRVAAAAKNLDKALGAFFGDGGNFGKRGSAPFAGALLESAIDDAVGGGDKTIGFLPRLTAYRRWLATLVEATEEARRRANDTFLPSRSGRPKGAGGNPFFQ